MCLAVWNQAFEKFDKQLFGKVLSRIPWMNGECDFPRGTRGKAHSLFAFEVTHLAAGGMCLFFLGREGNQGVVELEAVQPPRFGANSLWIMV
ncbi:hypothetical protein DBB_35220 [Desulfoluna spongiiphila]|nr:hypothetical protein DBB_35220 [Desulfoluna spongiiphila]